MSEIATRGNTLPAEYVAPAERHDRIAKLDALADYFRKIKDLERLRETVDEKLVQQAAAAVDYKALFPHGGDRVSDAATKSTLSVDLVAARVDWLRDLGVSDQTIRRWLAFTDDQEREKKADAIVARVAKLLGGDIAANFSSETNEWYTPARYVEAVRALYGGSIDLDPATCAKANETVQASQIFTLGDDALRHDWHGCAFLNPPYGTDKGESVAGQFVRKAIAEHKAGRLEECVILVNSSHSQKWQAPIYAYPVCFVDHRIAFVNGAGESNENPTFQNIFCYLGPRIAAFAGAFSQFGYVMVRA